ncbi:MAG: hypothetical protein AB7L09_00450 [Nitrospira sp.]
MMIFNSSMHPQALRKNVGEPFDFHCDFCGTTEQGVLIKPSGKQREPWAVMPDGWSEIEDRREHAKKQFPVCCPRGDCRFEAEKHKT